MTSGPGVGVVGTGFGLRVHVPALRAAGFTVEALVGRDGERTARRAQRAGVPRALTSLSDALALPSVDAVTIATPPDTHASLVLEAVAAGRHVLCEKPFAIDADEAAAMQHAADEAGVVALVGHEFRFAPERVVVARALAAGRIGTPRLATFVQHIPLVADPAAPVPSWWFDPARGGGWLGASGSHLVDQVRVWLGEIDAVSASLPLVSARPVGSAEDSFTVLAWLRSGCVALLQQTAAAWGPPVSATRVVGDAGSIWVDDAGTAWVSTARGTELLDVPPDLALPAGPGPSDDPRHRFTHLELGPYTRLCQRFRTAIETGAPADGAATFTDGLAVTRVLDAIRKSAAAGGRTTRISA